MTSASINKDLQTRKKAIEAKQKRVTHLLGSWWTEALWLLDLARQNRQMSMASVLQLYPSRQIRVYS